MLATMTRATFAEYVGQKFRMHLGPADAIDLELVEVTGHEGRAPAATREPFSIVFRGPRSPVRPQRIYTLAHERLGTFDVFLVPIGPDKEGMRYEAVFS